MNWELSNIIFPSLTVSFSPTIWLLTLVDLYLMFLTHWGRVTHIPFSKLTIIGSDNGLLPCQCQAIIWTNAGILLIKPLGTNISAISITIHIFSFLKYIWQYRLENGGHLVLTSVYWWVLSWVYWPFSNLWGPFYYDGVTEIRTWVSNHTHGFMWYVITHPCFNFNLKLWHGWVLASHNHISALYINTFFHFKN